MKDKKATPGEMARRRLAFFAGLVLKALARRRSRLLTALLAIGIGSTVLSGMLAVYLDMPRQLEREFRSYGANLILAPAGDLGIMSLDAAEEAAEYLPPDKLIGATPYRYEPLSINRQHFTGAGVRFSQARKTSPYWRVEGEWPRRVDEILIGADIARFTGIAPGTMARVSGRARDGSPAAMDMIVSGVLTSGGSEDGVVFMELSSLERLLGGAGEVSLVEISVSGSEDELKAMVGEIEANVSGLVPRLVRRLAHSEAAVLGKLRFLTFLVTAVVMGLILICVATTMMTAVMERRREIGLKKALGADSSAIVCEFLGEGAALGLAGGLLGSFGGYFFAQIVGVGVFVRNLDFSFAAALITAAAATGIAVLASLLPVLRAAEVEPALVLRGE
ncbi:MAG: FtsX-like permease family protein [Planctomycetota bacterium]|jgi:putative ABC transport system permease protein|nr:FtsX-like permease family protein [Planctomycetota bacterium]